MQPFDALSIRAVLQEAKPLLLNKRVDKVIQLARDEILDVQSCDKWKKENPINIDLNERFYVIWFSE